MEPPYELFLTLEEYIYSLTLFNSYERFAFRYWFQNISIVLLWLELPLWVDKRQFKFQLKKEWFILLSLTVRGLLFQGGADAVQFPGQLDDTLVNFRVGDGILPEGVAGGVNEAGDDQAPEVQHEASGDSHH